MKWEKTGDKEVGAVSLCALMHMCMPCGDIVLIYSNCLSRRCGEEVSSMQRHTRKSMVPENAVKMERVQERTQAVGEMCGD